MKRLGARLAAVLLIASFALACQTTTTRRPRGGEASTGQAFFWEVTGSDGSRFFLLGSVHIGDGRELALDPRIETDWKTAQELVVELDLTAPSPIDAVEATNRHGLLPEPRSLKEVVRADTYKQVTQYMKKHEYSMDRVDQMRPWLVALVVQDLEYGAAGLKAENGVDAVLLRRAKGQKPIVALESLDEQMAAFAELPDGLQETWLTDVLRDSANLPAFTRQMMQVWEAGDDAQMSALLFPDVGSQKDQLQFYDRMYWSRNQVMADRLTALAVDGKPRFVVVGTGHLLGPRGIPELLAQRGYQVKRLGSAHVVGATTGTTPVAAAVVQPATVAKPALVAPAVPTAPTPAVAPVTSTAPAAVPARIPLRPADTFPGTAPTRAAPTVAVEAPAAPVTSIAPKAAPASIPLRPADSFPGTAPLPAAAPIAAPAPRSVPTIAQPAQKGREIHDQWLGQDADQATQPAPAPPPAAAAPPDPPPAPVAKPKPAPAKQKAAPPAKKKVAPVAKKKAAPAAKKITSAKKPVKKTQPAPATGKR